MLAIKAWVVNPYRIPSSSMEPTLHCAAPEPGCQAGTSDRVLANRFIYRFTDPDRGDIVVFETPPEAANICPGPGGVFVKRLIGLPGDEIEIRGDQLYVNGEPLAGAVPLRRARSATSFGPITVARGPLLHDGRQPAPVLRQPRVGHRCRATT